MEAVSQKEILENFLEEATRRFGKIEPSDRKLYGKEHGRDKLLAFARYIDPDFICPSHVKKIAEKLEAVERGEIKRLIINMPPRHGKSYLTSQIFPAWYRGRHPEKEIIQSSYNDDKAASFTRWVRDCCESTFFNDIFPECSLNKSKRAASEWHTMRGGVHLGAGVGGGITGYGGHLVLIDDPVKNYDQAVSATIQDKIWDWYISTLRTRLYPNSVIILIMTRWVEDDLAGRLIKRDGLLQDGGKWDTLILPMIDEKNNVLCPEMFDYSEAMDLKESLDYKIWMALYQQEPVDKIERLFSDPLYSEAPDELTKIAYLDPAFGGDDYSALSIGCVERRETRNDDIAYIIGGYAWKGQIDITYDRVEKICKNENVATLYIEANQAQKVLKYEFKRRGLHVGLVTNVRDKHFRIVNAVKVNWPQIRFSKKIDPHYMKQVLKYSELARDKDAADALAGLINQLGLGKTPLESRYGNMLGRLGRRFR